MFDLGAAWCLQLRLRLSGVDERSAGPPAHALMDQLLVLFSATETITSGTELVPGGTVNSDGGSRNPDMRQKARDGQRFVKTSRSVPQSAYLQVACLGPSAITLRENSLLLASVCYEILLLVLL